MYNFYTHNMPLTFSFFVLDLFFSGRDRRGTLIWSLYFIATVKGAKDKSAIKWLTKKQQQQQAVYMVLL